MANEDFRLPREDTVGANSHIVSDKSPLTYLTCTQVGAHWHGPSSLQNIVVFGDSYSFDGGGGMTWADFLAKSVSSLSPAAIILNNFAFPGATVEYDLGEQLSCFFAQFVEEIGPGDATFFFFLGINDCGGFRREDPLSLVEVIFDAVQRLYNEVSARNFVLVDVPPTDRSPAAGGGNAYLASRIERWNDLLVARASDFTTNNPESTLLVFSSHKVLSEVLDDPGAHGFPENARKVVGQGVWQDALHLTPAVHEIIASRMSSALGFD